MKKFFCSKCGSEDVFIDKRGNQNALMCGECGAWIKWIGKKELPLIERFINSNVDQIELSKFKSDLNLRIQRLGLDKTEVIEIVDSLYRK